MSNWFSKLLNRNQSDADQVFVETPENSALHSTPKKPQQTFYNLQRTAPSGQKKTDQPLAVLQQFAPLKNIAEDNVTEISHKTLRYNADAVIFLQGDLADAVYYLLNGTVEIHPDTDDNFDLSLSAPTQPKASYEVSAKTSQAHLPLNYGKTFGATAIAKTNVDVIVVANDLLPLWSKQSRANASFIDLMDIKLPPELIGNDEFFVSFTLAYQKNKLQLPSLPHVAIKLRNAMKNDISVREAVEIIQIDPAIVTKLIQVSNSPLYAPLTPIKNGHDAVSRLGLDATRNLVMSINIKQLFQCKNKQIFELMQQTWKQSIMMSSLCFVLAEEVGGVNPEEALLAGLVCDIGIIPLLHFAEQKIVEQQKLAEAEQDTQTPKKVSFNDLHIPIEAPDLHNIIQTLPYLRAPLGKLVLNTLGFTEELADIPYHAENWFYDSGDKIQLIDIVILAKLHSYLGTEKAKELPHINAIPAYSKLKNRKLDADFSLSLLRKAHQRINETMNILA